MISVALLINTSQEDKKLHPHEVAKMSGVDWGFYKDICAGILHPYEIEGTADAVKRITAYLDIPSGAVEAAVKADLYASWWLDD